VSLDDPAARAALRRAAEAAKVALSAAEVTTADLPGLGARVEVERGRLEECAAEVRRKVVAITKRAVEEVAGLAWRDIAEVVLVGGQTLMPAIRRDLAELTGRPPRADDRPQLAVALGAGTYAHHLSRGEEHYHENTLINVLALPLGIRLTDAGDENHFEPLVPANATLPYVSPPLAVTTTADHQPSIEVEVFQGPRGATRTTECVSLGSVVLPVLPAPAGAPKFEVTLDVQNDATVWVEVRDARREAPQRHRLLGRLELAWREGKPG
jgi:molecular chaperone DnaK